MAEWKGVVLYDGTAWRLKRKLAYILKIISENESLKPISSSFYFSIHKFSYHIYLESDQFIDSQY